MKSLGWMVQMARAKTPPSNASKDCAIQTKAGQRDQDFISEHKLVFHRFITALWRAIGKVPEDGLAGLRRVASNLLDLPCHPDVQPGRFPAELPMGFVQQAPGSSRELPNTYPLDE
jgi:hypothetical protein